MMERLSPSSGFATTSSSDENSDHGSQHDFKPQKDADSGSSCEQPNIRHSLSGGPPRFRRRRARTRFDQRATERLEAVFLIDQYPDITLREHLGEELGFSEAIIHTWFQNKRSRAKRMSGLHSNRYPGNMDGGENDYKDTGKSTINMFEKSPILPQFKLSANGKKTPIVCVKPKQVIPCDDRYKGQRSLDHMGNRIREGRPLPLRQPLTKGRISRPWESDSIRHEHSKTLTPSNRKDLNANQNSAFRSYPSSRKQTLANEENGYQNTRHSATAIPTSILNIAPYPSPYNHGFYAPFFNTANNSFYLQPVGSAMSNSPQLGLLPTSLSAFPYMSPMLSSMTTSTPIEGARDFIKEAPQSPSLSPVQRHAESPVFGLGKKMSSRARDQLGDRARRSAEGSSDSERSLQVSDDDSDQSHHFHGADLIRTVQWDSMDESEVETPIDVCN